MQLHHFPLCAGPSKTLGFLALTTALACGGPQILIEALTSEGYIQVRDGDTSPTGPTQFFGTVDGNGSDNILYRITNTGDEVLRIARGDRPPSSSSPEFTISEFPRITEPADVFVQPDDTLRFRVSLSPTTQFPSATITLNSNTDNDSERIFTFAVAGRGNLGVAKAFYRSPNSTEREIENGDVSPTFSKGTNFGDVPINNPPNEDPVNYFAMKSLASGTGDTLVLSEAKIEGPDADDFNVTGLGATWEQGTEARFNIQFDPSSTGEKTATLTVKTNEPGRSPYTFALRGNGITVPEVLVEGQDGSGNFRVIADGTTEISFANGTSFAEVNVGQTVSHTFQITNSGDGPLEFTDPGVSDNFSLNGFPTEPIAPGATEQFTISFTPTSPGLHEGIFAAFSNIPGIGIYDFAIAGIGTAPALTLEQQIPDGSWLELDEGQTRRLLGGLSTNISVVGEPTLTGTFRLINRGNSDLVISNRGIIGEGADQFSYDNFPSPLTLGGGEAHQFNILLNPSTPGNVSPTFNILANIPTSPFDFKITTHVLEGSEITFSGRPDDGTFSPISGGAALSSFENGTAFRQLEDGETSLTSTFSFTNSGENDLIYSFEGLTGTHAEEFTVNSLSSGTLAPNESHEFSITHTPTAPTNRVALFHLVTNDPNHRDFTFPLLGNAATPGDPVRAKIASFVISGSDAEIQFASQPGTTYRLRFSNTLAGDSWQDVPGIPAITGSANVQTLQFSDLIDANEAKRFYRIEPETTP